MDRSKQLASDVASILASVNGRQRRSANSGQASPANGGHGTSAFGRPGILATLLGGASLLGGVTLTMPAHAEEKSESLEEVVVTGLRGSLQASMDVKREAIGVVDAINAEDIG